MLSVDLNLARKYNEPVPRYTSYPPATAFRDEGEPERLLRHVDDANRDDSLPLSLYFHLPFCESLCWFCGCTTVITRNQRTSADYLSYLEREIDLLAKRVHPGRRVVQLHFGGGTPTFFRAAQLAWLMNAIRRRFRFAADAELSVEI